MSAQAAAEPPAGAAGSRPVDGSFATNPVLRHHWFALARTSELSGAPVGRTLLTERVVLFRDADGAPVALPDRCSHRNAPLSLGELRDGCVACPYHGWTFDGGGRCVHVPSSGVGATVPPRAHLAPFHAVARYGLVWVCLDEPWGAIPEIPQDVDPTYRRINQVVEHWHASSTRMADNFLDYSHFPWVHRASFGGASALEIPGIELGEMPDGWVGYEYDVLAANPAAGQEATGVAGDTVERHMTTSFTLPLAVRSTIHYASGLDHIILMLSTPIDDDTSYFTFIIWRNDDFAHAGDEVTQLDRQIGAEDKWMLERVPGPLPLSNDGTVSVQSDKPSVEWRRRLKALLAGEPVADRSERAAVVTGSPATTGS
jgi:phenylpropionate dioxygenase-like ring-hydroxylating dioxygenase large terminal subunit